LAEVFHASRRAAKIGLYPSFSARLKHDDARDAGPKPPIGHCETPMNFCDHQLLEVIVGARIVGRAGSEDRVSDADSARGGGAGYGLEHLDHGQRVA
jgi:hypothetical protein